MRISSKIFKLKKCLDSKKEIGGGTTLDMGVYTIQLCQWVFQEPPKSIKATGSLNDDGVDTEMSAELIYSGNKIGKMQTSTTTTLPCTAKIVGTKGEITVNAMLLQIILIQ